MCTLTDIIGEWHPPFFTYIMKVLKLIKLNEEAIRGFQVYGIVGLSVTCIFLETWVWIRFDAWLCLVGDILVETDSYSIFKG